MIVTENLTGKINEGGTLLVLGRLPDRVYKGNYKQAVWACKCLRGSCNNFISVLGKFFKSGHTKSCGCIGREGTRTTHGLTRHPLYKVHRGMLNRCHNEEYPDYKRWGKKGIVVCEEWRIEENSQGFLNFYNWAMENGYREGEGLSIERIKNKKGPYSPQNCKWATPQEQANNRESNTFVHLYGEDLTLSQAADKFGLKYGTLQTRVYRNRKNGNKLTDTQIVEALLAIKEAK